MKHIPNILSFIRIGLVGVFVWLFLSGRYAGALVVYAAAFLTDVLDGYLARRFNWITPLGKLLDPFADKLMVIAALVCICIRRYEQPVYLILFILTLAKECLMIAGGVFMLKKRSVVVYADWFGKTATGMFAAGIILTLLSFPLPMLQPWNVFVLIAAVTLSYVAMFHYANVQIFHRKDQKNTNLPFESKKAKAKRSEQAKDDEPCKDAKPAE